ncbi:MAG: hypothetical protein H0V71_10885 [Chloroflexi bacterium]|nr:hypothetical protein [Chloroflexota bacterium]
MTAVLMVAGAILELAGLALVALDVRQSHREGERLSRPDKLIQVGAAIAHARAFAPTVQGGGTPPVPSLEERVSTLEDEVERLQRDLRAAEERETHAHREMTDRFAEWIAEARRETFDLGQALKGLIGTVAAGNVRRRVAGVALFGAGLFLQTVGNLAAL